MNSTHLGEQPLFKLTKHSKTGSIDFLSARNECLTNPLMNNENDYQLPLNMISDTSISLIKRQKSS